MVKCTNDRHILSITMRFGIVENYDNLKFKTVHLYYRLTRKSRRINNHPTPRKVYK